MTERITRPDVGRDITSDGDYTILQESVWPQAPPAVTKRSLSTPDSDSADVPTPRASGTLAVLALMLLIWFGGGCSVAESPKNTLDADIEILTYVQDTVPVVRDAILKENELVTEIDGGTLESKQKAKYIEEKILPVERSLLEAVNKIEPTDPELQSAHREAVSMAEKGVAAFSAYRDYYAGDADARTRAAQSRSDQVRHRSAWMEAELALEKRVGIQ